MKFNRLFSAEGLSPWVVCVALVGLAPAAWSEEASPSDSKPVEEPTHSALNAPLFYEILLGEMEAQNGQAGNGFSLLLDAARRSNDPRLFARALSIALEAHSGESALQAATQWQAAEPKSREANFKLLQVLLALNRVPETKAPLEREIALTPAAFKIGVLANIPSLYANVSNKKEAAELVEKVLKPLTTETTLSMSAWLSIARMQALANEPDKALKSIQAAAKSAPDNDLPVLLALDLMQPKAPEMEQWAQAQTQLRGKAFLHLAYARALAEAQRLTPAELQAQAAVKKDPQLADAWLLLGVLQTQENAALQAEQSLTTYLSLVKEKTKEKTEDKTEDKAETADALERGRTQAYLALAQLAEKRQDFKTAEKWMAEIKRPHDLLAVQSRRASLMAAQGQLEAGLALLQAVPDNSPDDARGKLIAQVQLLRDHHQTARAMDLLAKASTLNPDDADLLYEQAMLAEKLGLFDKMESLLRDVMAKQPNNPSAFNALGYSLADRGIRLAEARDLIQKALANAPNDPFITDSLGWLEFKAGRLALAAQLLKQAFKDKEDPEIAAHLGEVLWQQGEQAQAKTVWQRGMTLSPKNEALQNTLSRLGVKL